ncbi:MAG: hypothetical protein ACLP8S_19825 [Solirubrobacteraceae bacterium]
MELELELVDGAIADADAAEIATPGAVRAGATQPVRGSRADRRPGRLDEHAPSVAAIFRASGDWLTGELGRPPLVGDLDTDTIAAYARHLASADGRGGRPAALATSRVYIQTGACARACNSAKIASRSSSAPGSVLPGGAERALRSTPTGPTRTLALRVELRSRDSTQRTWGARERRCS